MRQSTAFFPAQISPDLYFWDMLPYAVPGLLTFVVGMVLGTISLVRATRRERVGYYVSFGVTCIAFASLGLVISLRALIEDTRMLQQWNTYIYPFVVLLSPASTHLIHYILDGKFPRPVGISAFINWLFTAGALVSIFTGRAFTGEFLYYSFGKFPVAALPLKLWGAASALTFVTIGLPVFYLYQRRHSFAGRRTLFMGHSLLLALTISNLPSFAGVPLFPGATFSFIPMCLMAYGVFNSDFRNLKDLFFEKNALFYIMNVLAGLILLALTYVVLFRFSPAYYATLNWYPWLLIPMGSLFFVVALGILIGGTNPTNPLNQYGAFSLFIYGFLLLSVLVGGLRTKPLVAHRIEQLCYMVFGLAPAVQLRFAYLSLNRPAPGFRRLLDISSVALSVLAMTPWLFTGYFEYPWGRISEAGPVVQAYGVVGLFAISVVLRDWWKSRDRTAPNRLGDFSVLYLATGGLMIFGNLPGTLGFEFYPTGNLTILPTLIMAYAILRYGRKTLRTESLRISALLLPFAFAAVAGFLFFVWHSLPEGGSLPDRRFHILLAGTPLVLFAFLATFVLIRPVAARIDVTLYNLQMEKERALQSQRETERQKVETEKLNLLLKSLNEEIDLKIILAKVQEYVAQTFGFDWHALYGVSPDKTQLQLLSLRARTADSASDQTAPQKIQIPLNQNGLHAQVIRTHRAFFIPNVKSSRIVRASTAEESAVTDRHDLYSFLLLPLVLNNAPVGVLDFSSTRGKVALSRDDLARLSILAEQITGVIYSSRLFRQVQEEREKSEKLLLNILPQDVAAELKEKGFAEPVQFEAVSVLFTDFQGFTKIAEFMSPNDLIRELDACFVQFDKVTERHGLEKLKTIGDSYMCAGGVPKPNPTHAIDCVLAAMEIRNFMLQMQEIKKSLGEPYWQLRIGIHSGPLIAGVIGEKKFAYDVWGDTVNTASRMESSGTSGKINISGATYELIKNFFRCEYRGKIGAKNKGDVDMYYVLGLKPEYAIDGEGRVPNEKLWDAAGGATASSRSSPALLP